LVIGNSSCRLNLDHLYEEMWGCGKLYLSSYIGKLKTLA
jgi:hypothetical protein